MKDKIKNIFNNTLLKKGASDTSYYMIANVGSRALGFFIIPILARTVSVEAFANYDLFLLISSLLQIFVILGIDSGIVILLTESKDDNVKLSFYYVIALIISLGLLLILTLSFSFIFMFTDELFYLSQAIWQLMGFYILFSVISYHTFNFLRWRSEAKKAAFINLFGYVCGVLIGLYFLYTEKSIDSFLLGLVMGAFLGSLFSLYVARNYIREFKILDNSKELIKELMKLSLPFVPNYLGNNLMQMVDRVIILMLFGKEELGLYAVIMRLAAIPQFLVGTITSGFMPVMYQNYKTEHGRKLIRNFFNVYFIMIPILFISVFTMSDLLVDLFAGKEYQHIAYLFPMALVSILFVNGTRAGGLGYSISRKTHYIMYITFLSVAINFAVSLCLALWIGLSGVILGTLIGGVIRTYLHIKYSEKLYSFDYNFKLLGTISFLTIGLSYYSVLAHP